MKTGPVRGSQASESCDGADQIHIKKKGCTRFIGCTPTTSSVARSRRRPPYSTVMLKEKSRVSPGAMTVTLRLCSNTSSSLVSVA